MAQENALAIINPNQAGQTFCSIKRTGDRAQDARIFGALNNPKYRLADFINKQIAVTNVLVEVRDIMSEETGEIETVPRTVLIDENGESYQATSKGIFSAVMNAFEVFGNAPWEPALLIEVKQRAVKQGSMLTFDVIG